ncbi:MAG TPA: aldo/keto reductase [Caulobacteraceae bacterium]|jgi:aryl-alcohol dehydrogenase-like predicted oxidoreductase|nr:aldo/keto reductase [Caulobacteraceae bacterium]
MRYRPFGNLGAAVSCVSLALTDEPMRQDERVKLIYGALEAGINTFELQTRDPEVAATLGDALAAVERRMVFVALRVGWSRDRSGARIRDLSPAALTGTIETALASSRLGHFEVVVIDVGDNEILPGHVIPTLQASQQAHRVGMLGVAGADGVDRYLDTGDFDVLATAYNIRSGWRERNRLKHAAQADMPIIGCDFQPFAPRAAAAIETARPSGPFGLGRLLHGGGHKEKIADAYAFLERSGTWSAEEICLAYALTEPALTTVQTRARSVEQLQRLAGAAEKELPNGVAAQIEMARFSVTESDGAA